MADEDPSHGCMRDNTVRVDAIDLARAYRHQLIRVAPSTGFPRRRLLLAFDQEEIQHAREGSAHLHSRLIMPAEGAEAEGRSASREQRRTVPYQCVWACQVEKLTSAFPL